MGSNIPNTVKNTTQVQFHLKRELALQWAIAYIQYFDFRMGVRICQITIYEVVLPLKVVLLLLLISS
jgi:hypothetical protein